MAVGAAYLTKIRTAIRRSSIMSANLEAELVDTVEECRADLVRLGLPSTITASETDVNILDAVKRYARWRWEADPIIAERCYEEYAMKADELRKSRDYMYYTITFTVTAAGVPLPDAEITFNGESLETGAAGTAVFYYVSAGVNQEYTVEADGYTTQTVDLDVTASSSVSVVMVAV